MNLTERHTITRVKDLGWQAALQLARDCHASPAEGYRVVDIRVLDRNRSKPALSITFRRIGDAPAHAEDQWEEYLRVMVGE